LALNSAAGVSVATGTSAEQSSAFSVRAGAGGISLLARSGAIAGDVNIAAGSSENGKGGALSLLGGSGSVLLASAKNVQSGSVTVQTGAGVESTGAMAIRTGAADEGGAGAIEVAVGVSGSGIGAALSLRGSGIGVTSEREIVMSSGSSSAFQISTARSVDDSGAVEIRSGDSEHGNAGSVSVRAGGKQGFENSRGASIDLDGKTGAVSIQSSDSGGDVSLTSASGKASGEITIGTGSAASGRSGSISIAAGAGNSGNPGSGSVSILASNGPAGRIQILSGTGRKSSGSIAMRTPDGR
jgi:hypothetical protein